MNLTIRTPDNIPLSVSWNNYEKLKYFEYYQTRNFSFIDENISKTGPTSVSDKLFLTVLRRKIKNKFARFIKTFGDVGQVNTIVCVGSGTSVLELFLSQYYKNATFYLIDKSEFNLTPESKLYTVGDNQNTVFQNSWDVLKDGITASNLDKKRFIMLDPTDEWPENIDIIHSEWSWAWHYSSSFYENQTLAKLRPNGRLGLSVLTIPDEANSFIERMSVGFNDNPTIENIYLESDARTKHQYPSNDVQTGGFYTWNNNN